MVHSFRGLALGLLFPCALLSAQPREIRTFAAALAGEAAAPVVGGELTLFRLEDYDAKGRLVLLGYRPLPEAVSEDDATSEKTETAPDAGGLRFLGFRYDDHGRILELNSAADRGAPPESSMRRVYGEDGRLLRVEGRSGEALEFVLDFSYEGSGRFGRALLRKGDGSVVEAADFVLGGGAAEGGLLSFDRFGADGASLGSLLFSYDAAGRLTSYECHPAAITAEAPAERSNPRGSPSPAVQEKVPADGNELDIAGILLPLWPGTAPSFAFVPLLGLAPSPSILRPEPPFASGFTGLPFDPPEDGRAEFLYDGAGRLILARRFDATGELDFECSYRYDARGFLAGEERRYRKGAEPSQSLEGPRTPEASPEGDLSADDYLYIYREGGAGDWRSRSSFRRQDSFGGSLLVPIEYQERLRR